MDKNDKSTLLKLVRLYKCYTRQIVCILVCVVVSSGISLLIPLAIKRLTDNGLVKGNYTEIVILSLVCLLLTGIDEGIELLETKFYSYINSIMPYELNKKAFKHAMRLKMAYFNNTNTNELMNNIDTDIRNITRVSDRGTFYIISSILRMIGGVAGLVLIDWRLALMVLAVLPARYVFVKKFAAKRRKQFEGYLEQNRDYAAWYGDVTGGVKDIKLNGLDRVFTGEFIGKQRGLIRSGIRMSFTDKYNEISEVLLYQALSSLLYILGGLMVVKGSLTIGGLFVFITYSIYVTGPVSTILNIGYSFSNVLPSARRLFNFFEMEHEDYRKGLKTGLDCQGNVSFKDVCFSYKENEPVLNDISLDIKEGEKVAIIGGNGSGKSTLVNLLTRLYTPGSGEILIGGRNINEYSLREYRDMISVVSQDLYLFNTTIEKNIALRPGISELEMHKAAKLSTANEFIEALPEKYKNNVGRNGAAISGGEKQKLALARALVRNSKIIILDEATSSFDVESEIRVNSLLGKELKDRTVVIIAHRTEVLKRVDRIFMLEDGRIAAQGTHEELCLWNEAYRKLIENGSERIVASAGI